MILSFIYLNCKKTGNTITLAKDLNIDLPKQGKKDYQKQPVQPVQQEKDYSDKAKEQGKEHFLLEALVRG